MEWVSDATDTHCRASRPGVWHNANRCAANPKSDSPPLPAATRHDCNACPPRTPWYALPGMSSHSEIQTGITSRSVRSLRPNPRLQQTRWRAPLSRKPFRRRASVGSTGATSGQQASVCRTDAQDPRRAFLIASSIAASLCVSSQRTTGVVGVRADGQPSCREIPVRPLDRALLNFGIVKRQ